jgi:phosphohistidine swiveling domain-containing protein/glycerol-3-phosphate acyltransferase PlsY
MGNFWGYLIILIGCPVLGGLPLIDWIFYLFNGKKLQQLGTGNISVSAAFYHGGQFTGILSVLSEAAKGIIAVLLARYFLPQAGESWELIALICLVIGRYFFTKGAGTTNVVWGIVVHDFVSALLIFLISGVSFTVIREKKFGKFTALFLLGLILALRHPYQEEYIICAIILASLIGLIYQCIPDDLDLSMSESTPSSQKMFKFFRGDKNLISLKNTVLNSEKFGQKAANLSRLSSWGYHVPDGWVIPPGEDWQFLLDYLQPSLDDPLVVRSSAIGEDGDFASSAGQYLSVLNITNKEFLKLAIVDCLASYQRGNAAQYRLDQSLSDTGMAILVQKQVQGVFSGVAFSRNPVNQLENCVVIEALPGDATQVVGGKITPQQYKVFITENDVFIETKHNNEWEKQIIREVAKIAREVEQLCQGIPQDLEWSYDGEILWLLQTRPITNLQPLWTRKIASEVIPGFIRPLTWSMNKPLTCGVWGEIFTLVLGEKSKDLNFDETATLHYHRAYFNATLLGEIFRKMGLPPESLEFLTRGAKFSKPPLKTTLMNIQGLVRLLFRELHLEKDFTHDYKQIFTPLLREVKELSPDQLTDQELLARINKILLVLKKATYYSILAPLSFALRQAIFKIPDHQLDNGNLPEIESMKSLGKIAKETRNLIPVKDISDYNCASLFTYLAENPEGESILKQLESWLNKYGYLSDVATDISIPRWQDDPRYIRQIFTEFLLREITSFSKVNKQKGWPNILVQGRLNLKGRVTKIYSQLLAHLRWTFLALEKNLLANGILKDSGDIFFLELSEIINLIENHDKTLLNNLENMIQIRRFQWQQSQEIPHIPFLIYGNPFWSAVTNSPPFSSQQRFQGIGASAGIVEGQVKILPNLEGNTNVNKNTILVVNYTDSGWTPVLSRAGGLIAEVGGKLSHGAIIAREYKIPAVMDIENITNILKNDQWVRIDGQAGLVEIIDR